LLLVFHTQHSQELFLETKRVPIALSQRIHEKKEEKYLRYKAKLILVQQNQFVVLTNLGSDLSMKRHQEE
jgi:predicted transport protein